MSSNLSLSAPSTAVDCARSEIRAPPTSATWQHYDTGTCETRTMTLGAAQKVRAERCHSVRQAPYTHRCVSDSNDSSPDAPRYLARRTHRGPGAVRDEWIRTGRPPFLHTIAGHSPSPASPAQRCPSPQTLSCSSQHPSSPPSQTCRSMRRYSALTDDNSAESQNAQEWSNRTHCTTTWPPREVQKVVQRKSDKEDIWCSVPPQGTRTVYFW